MAGALALRKRSCNTLYESSMVSEFSFFTILDIGQAKIPIGSDLSKPDAKLTMKLDNFDKIRHMQHLC